MHFGRQAFEINLSLQSHCEGKFQGELYPDMGIQRFGEFAVRELAGDHLT